MVRTTRDTCLLVDQCSPSPFRPRLRDLGCTPRQGFQDNETDANVGRSPLDVPRSPGENAELPPILRTPSTSVKSNSQANVRGVPSSCSGSGILVYPNIARGHPENGSGDSTSRAALARRRCSNPRSQINLLSPHVATTITRIILGSRSSHLSGAIVSWSEICWNRRKQNTTAVIHEPSRGRVLVANKSRSPPTARLPWVLLGWKDTTRTELSISSRVSQRADTRALRLAVSIFATINVGSKMRQEKKKTSTPLHRAENELYP